MASTYEQKMTRKIAVCGNTARVYIIQGIPRIASEYAKVAAHLAFVLRPDLRDSQ